MRHAWAWSNALGIAGRPGFDASMGANRRRRRTGEGVAREPHVCVDVRFKSRGPSTFRKRCHEDRFQDTPFWGILTHGKRKRSVAGLTVLRQRAALS